MDALTLLESWLAVSISVLIRSVEVSAIASMIVELVAQEIRAVLRGRVHV